mgnify:FL=1
MIEAVIFDMDGLMFDTERLCSLAWDWAGEQMGIGPAGYMNLRTLGVTAPEARRILLEEFGQDFDVDRMQSLAREFTADYLGKNPLPVKPGLYTLLDYLKGQGLPLAVASSTREETVRRHLRAAGIEGRFAAVVCGDMVTHSKPHPEIYELACARLGKTPPSCAALEDSRNGLRSAHAAGCRAVMVPDLWQPDPETEAFLAAKGETLDQLIPWFAAHIKKEG